MVAWLQGVDQAVDLLREALAQRGPANILMDVHHDPDFEPVAGSPGFQELMRAKE
jgi:hypothetical protein